MFNIHYEIELDNYSLIEDRKVLTIGTYEECEKAKQDRIKELYQSMLDGNMSYRQYITIIGGSENE